jgi:hypothetical protein
MFVKLFMDGFFNSFLCLCRCGQIDDADNDMANSRTDKSDNHILEKLNEASLKKYYIHLFDHHF